jgi:hypothetical protein
MPTNALEKDEVFAPQIILSSEKVAAKKYRVNNVTLDPHFWYATRIN